MKGFQQFVIAVVIGVLGSAPIWAGNIGAFTDFNAGDTVSAAAMNSRFNTIRDAVNDNDTRMPGIELIDSPVAVSLTGTAAAVATINVTAPAAGFLYVNAFGNISCDTANSSRVVLRNDTDNVEGPFYVHSHNANEFHRYSISHVFPVGAGTDAIQLLSRCTGGTAGTINVETLTAIYIPRRL
jgi:hypothetical protein